MNSQITLPVAELKEALPGLCKVVSRKSTLPALQSIRLSRSKEGRVTLSATDLDTFVTYNVEQFQPGKPLDVLLPFEQLNKTVKGSNGNVIVIPESAEKVKLHYQIGDSPLEQSVATTKLDEFPPAPRITQPSVKLPANFGETLRQAFETSSTDGSRYVLNGAYLDVEQPKCHSIVSTNGGALFAANSFNFDLKASVNIPRQKFLAWPGFLEGECELAVQSNKSASDWVQLTTPRWTCIVKQIEGLYPKWRQVVPEDTETWTKVRLSEAAVAQILNLSTKLPGDDELYRRIQLRVNSKELHLEGKNKDDKDYTSAIITGVNITGKPVVIGLNRGYLQNALRCGLDEIRINDELSPLLFCRPGKRMVIMPVRLSGPPTTASGTPEPASPPQPSITEAPAPEQVPTPTTTSETNNERNNMPRTASANGTVETQSTQSKPAEASAFNKLEEQVEKIKQGLKGAVSDLNDLLKTVAQAHKEKRATEREIESIRESLQSIQRIKI